MRAFTTAILSIFAFASFGQSDIVKQAQSMMAGEFNSTEQAKNDTSFFDISLVMHPIWTADSTTAWLYVEQAVTSKPMKPYRQRIYRITQHNKTTVESAVFTLPNPEAFVHAWENDSLFSTLPQDSLEVRQGCSVFLELQADGSFIGSTKEKECQSSLYGAAYATSIVSVHADKVVSWDQGWDDNDEQVWGAENSGYIFLRRE